MSNEELSFLEKDLQSILEDKYENEYKKACDEVLLSRGKGNGPRTILNKERLDQALNSPRKKLPKGLSREEKRNFLGGVDILEELIEKTKLVHESSDPWII